jgi:hypothetical protein
MADSLTSLKQEMFELLNEEQKYTTDYVNMLSPSSTATSAEIAAQRAKIVAVYNRRQNLYKLIQNAVILHNSTNTLINNTYEKTLKTNNELEGLLEIKDKIAERIGQDKATNHQLASANINYGKQYSAYRKLFIALIIILVCLIAASLLSYTPLVMASRPLTIGIYIIGGAYVAHLLINMLMKSNVNNDEYDWYFSPNNNENPNSILPPISGQLGFKPNLGGISSCAGEYCCDETQGTVWSEESQTCIAMKETN